MSLEVSPMYIGWRTFPGVGLDFDLEERECYTIKRRVSRSENTGDTREMGYLYRDNVDFILAKQTLSFNPYPISDSVRTPGNLLEVGRGRPNRTS